jgi:hypothetical protein
MNVQINSTAAGYQVGATAAEKIALHGATPVAQRAGASQAAVTATALTVGATYTQAEVEAVITRLAAATTLVNELRAALVEKGIIKGAA